MYKDIIEKNKKLRSLQCQINGKEDEIEQLNIRMVDKDNKLLRVEDEIVNKNVLIERVRREIQDLVRKTVTDELFSKQVVLVLARLT